MAEMTREQLEGAVMALERCGWTNQTSIWNALTSYRAQLAAMPPSPDLREALVEARSALEEVQEAMAQGAASIWDGHYGNGITVDYAKAVDKEMKDANGKASAAMASIDAVLGEVKS